KGTPSNGTWTGTFVAPANSGETPQQYTATFSATDAGGNPGSAAVAPQFTVDGNDTTAPALTNPLASPSSLTSAGGLVNLSVTAADTVGVTSVRAEITKPDHTQVIVSLSRTSGTS